MGEEYGVVEVDMRALLWIVVGGEEYGVVVVDMRTLLPPLSDEV